MFRSVAENRHTHLVHFPQLEVLNDLLGFAQLGFPSFQGCDVCVAVGDGSFALAMSSVQLVRLCTCAADITPACAVVAAL